MQVETPNVTLSFWNLERDGEEFRPHVGGFGIRVADVEAARRELEAKVILHRRYAPRG